MNSDLKENYYKEQIKSAPNRYFLEGLKVGINSNSSLNPNQKVEYFKLIDAELEHRTDKKELKGLERHLEFSSGKVAGWEKWKRDLI